MPTYEFGTRQEMAPLLPRQADKALDIGCGQGGFGDTLRGHYPAAWLVGVEPEPSQAASAREHFDEVHEGFFPEALPLGAGPFDVISLNDVVEHLADPWELLEQVKEYLAPRGCVVAAIPNVRHLPVSANLLFKGRWEYVGEGVLDRTHLRFFTRQTIELMFAAAGYRIDRLDRLNPPWVDKPHYRVLKAVPKQFGDLLHQHYGVVARPI